MHHDSGDEQPEPPGLFELSTEYGGTLSLDGRGPGPNLGLLLDNAPEDPDSMWADTELTPREAAILGAYLSDWATAQLAREEVKPL